MSSGRGRYDFFVLAILAFSITFLLLFTVLLPVRASAGIGFQPVNPDELKMKSEPQAPGAPAIILFREVDRNDDRYMPHEDNYLRIKILTEEGRNFANVELGFEKGLENIVNVHGRTIKLDRSRSLTAEYLKNQW